MGAAATATSSAAVSTATYLKTDTGVSQTYLFSVYKNEETYDSCDDKCIGSIIGSAGDMARAGGKKGDEAWMHYVDGVWQCEHKSYNTKLSFYYDYAHWDTSVDLSAKGCGVVKLGDMDETEGANSGKVTDNHWVLKDCSKKTMCMCQGSEMPKWQN